VNDDDKLQEDILRSAMIFEQLDNEHKKVILDLLRALNEDDPERIIVYKSGDKPLFSCFACDYKKVLRSEFNIKRFADSRNSRSYTKNFFWYFSLVVLLRYTRRRSRCWFLSRGTV